MAARTTLTFATSRPSGVAMTKATAKPTKARLTEVQRIDQTWPSSTILMKADQTSTGAGSLYSSVIADAQTICHTARNATVATRGGRPVARARRHHGRVLVVGVSRA